MGSLVRQYARRMLGSSGTAGLRGVGRHVTAAYSILRGRLLHGGQFEDDALAADSHIFVLARLR